MDSQVKRGQVTIFIILATLIVVAVIVAIVLRQDILNFFGGAVEPTASIKECVTEVLEPVTKQVLENAGELNPELSKMYNGSQYNYLCYQFVDYLPCINTHPMIKTLAEQALTEGTREGVEQCFDSLKKELEKRGHDTSFDDLTYSIELVPGKIEVNINRPTEISNEESYQSFEDFSFEILSQSYGLFNLAREIVNQESQYCYFDYNGFMILYPEYRITRLNYDNSLIYTAVHSDSNERIKFAIKGCTFPLGM